MPLECYEIIEKTTALRIGVLVINMAVMIYLILRLKRDARAKKSAA